jgi:hypothetical protein
LRHGDFTIEHILDTAIDESHHRRVRLFDSCLESRRQRMGCTLRIARECCGYDEKVIGTHAFLTRSDAARVCHSTVGGIS